MQGSKDATRQGQVLPAPGQNAGMSPIIEGARSLIARAAGVPVHKVKIRISQPDT